MTQISVRPEVELREVRLMNVFLENRCLRLAQQLSETLGERDQALADRDAIRAELEELRAEMRVQGERDADHQ